MGLDFDHHIIVDVIILDVVSYLSEFCESQLSNKRTCS